MSWARSRVDRVVHLIAGGEETNPVLARQQIMKLVEEVVAKAEEVARNADDGPDLANEIKKAILG